MDDDDADQQGEQDDSPPARLDEEPPVLPFEEDHFFVGLLPRKTLAGCWAVCACLENALPSLRLAGGVPGAPDWLGVALITVNPL